MEKYCPKCFKRYSASVEICPDDVTYLVSPMEKDLVGEVVDNRYTVLARIGHGGMGVVYKAEQHLIKRIVALKVLREEVVTDATAVKRFLNEARAIASLENPHTVTLHDFGITRTGLLYYTMEFLNGEPLSRMIERESPMNVYQATRLILQTCESLGEAHGRGILHRDLKPDNLFIVRRNQKPEVKVLDFGIAKLMTDQASDKVTRTGVLVGTPQYVSPEQALGNPVVPASDLYSLAVVLYEMLAGVPPFQGDTPMKTLWSHVHDRVPPVGVKNPSVRIPKSVELFLVKALDKDFSRRFATAPDFADALRRAVFEQETTEESLPAATMPVTGDGEPARGPGLSTEEQLVELAEVMAGVKAALSVPESAADEAGGRPLPGGSPLEPELEWRDTDERAGPAGGRQIVFPGPFEESANGAPSGPDETPTSVIERLQPVRAGWSSRRVTGAVGVVAGAAAIAFLFLWAPWTGGSRQGTEGTANGPGLPPRHAGSSSPAEILPPGDVADAGPVDGGGSAYGAGDGVPATLDGGLADARPGGLRENGDVLQNAESVAPMGGAGDVGLSGDAGTLGDGGDGRPVAEAGPAVTDVSLAGEREAPAAGSGPDSGASPSGEAEAAPQVSGPQAARRERRVTGNRAESLVERARREMAGGRYGEALGLLGDARTGGAETAEIDALSGECRAALDAARARHLVAAGKAQMARMDFAAAASSFEEASRLAPGSEEVGRLLKECREKQELDGLKFEVERE